MYTKQVGITDSVTAWYRVLKSICNSTCDEPAMLLVSSTIDSSDNDRLKTVVHESYCVAEGYRACGLSEGSPLAAVPNKQWGSMTSLVRAY